MAALGTPGYGKTPNPGSVQERLDTLASPRESPESPPGSSSPAPRAGPAAGARAKPGPKLFKKKTAAEVARETARKIKFSQTKRTKEEKDTQFSKMRERMMKDKQRYMDATQGSPAQRTVPGFTVND